MSHIFTDPAEVTLGDIRFSTFGCINCLWNHCECKNGSRFIPNVYQGHPSCKSYAFYD